MNSYKVFALVIEYIEENISKYNEIDYVYISKIAGCPTPLFQRIFIFISGVSISEYVRRRKLSLAGHDIRNSKEKIIDIAMKYGFNSHGSFTRAFREHHKASPTAIRNKKATLNNYFPISFNDFRIIGGKRVMAELKKIEYIVYDERKVVGMKRNTSFQKAGEDCWGTAIRDGLFEKLQDLDEYICKDIDDYFGLGHMSKFKNEDEFQYIIGKFMHRDTPIPENLYSEIIPAGKVAKIWIEGDNLIDIIDSAYLICVEAIEKTGYKINNESFYWCDIYTYERYIEPNNNGSKIILDYLLPVIKM